MTTNQEVRSIIDNIINKLYAAGLSNPVTYIEQLSYLFYLKMLEEWDNANVAEAKMTKRKYRSIFAGEKEKYRWSIWTHIPDNNEMFKFVRDGVFPFMVEIPAREDVRRFFQDARFMIPDGVVLRDVVDRLQEINFYELDADVKGDLYEYLLSQLATQRKAGQFRTPRHIIRTIVRLVNPQIGETALDPAAGTAGFLLGAFEWIKLQNSDPKTITEVDNGSGQKIKRGLGDKLTDEQWKFLENSTFFGFDVDNAMVKIANMNLLLHGLGGATVIRRDSIAGSPDDWEDRKFDVVVTNPPFAGTINKERVRKYLPVQSTDSTTLFLGLITQALRPGGRAGVIVNEGVLFGRNRAQKEIRRYILEHFDLEGVISLPAGVFQPYAGVKTSFLIFKNTGKKTEKVWFYDVRYDGFELATKRRPTPDKNDLPDLLEKWEKKPESERSWWADIEKIEENDFILSANSYNPNVGDREEKHRDPKEILREVKKLEEDTRNIVQRISKFL